MHIGGQLVPRASTGVSPFAATDVHLMIAEALMKETPRLTTYVRDNSVGDFVDWAESSVAVPTEESTPAEGFVRGV